MSKYEFPELPDGAQVNQEEWEKFAEVVARHHYRGLIRLLSWLPTGPRCEACGSPFGGIGGRIMRATGKGPSRKNPRWCASCFEMSPEGGYTATIGVLFADIRGSTELAEKTSSEKMAAILNRFYDRVTRVVVRHGLIDKLIGDEVMGIYLPPFSPGGRFVETMANDAHELLRSIGYGTDAGPILEVGVGLDVGSAYVGHVGNDEISDFTAIGDVVNTASRLQSVAGSGEIVMSEDVARQAGLGSGEGRRTRLDLKGKSEVVSARIVSIAD